VPLLKNNKFVIYIIFEIYKELFLELLVALAVFIGFMALKIWVFPKLGIPS